ncbi:hypothetical protein F0562_015269 [Nyssa sinensis]|uniref:Uncharacterized protein n=1 Tax=Nyssa sinensis TaxID=561372 RepID=A0A5J4ZGU4_9ASTE|nr:hypothetical protein F0562_015269 [Nyssa sinensis]
MTDGHDNMIAYGYNEYFWSVDYFRLGWPMRADAYFFRVPFEQAMIIIAWNGSGETSSIFEGDVFKKVLSIFIAAANALLKLHDLRQEENTTTIEEIVGILLNDNSPGVVGATAATFASVCPNYVFDWTKL